MIKSKTFSMAPKLGFFRSKYDVLKNLTTLKLKLKFLFKI